MNLWIFIDVNYCQRASYVSHSLNGMKQNNLNVDLDLTLLYDCLVHVISFYVHFHVVVSNVR